MSILSQIVIKKLLSDGSLEIKPPPKDEDFDSDAVEVHLGGKIYEWARQPGGSTLTISLWKKASQSSGDDFSYNEFAKQHLKEVPPDNAGIVTLRPHTFYLADLKQFTKLPHDVAMHVQGKSSLARLGVVIHLTAPHAHAGWQGWLTLEIYNLGPFNIELKSGMAIGQLTFWRVEEPDETLVRKSQFSNQANAAGEKIDPSESHHFTKPRRIAGLCFCAALEESA